MVSKIVKGVAGCPGEQLGVKDRWLEQGRWLHIWYFPMLFYYFQGVFLWFLCFLMFFYVFVWCARYLPPILQILSNKWFFWRFLSQCLKASRLPPFRWVPSIDGYPGGAASLDPTGKSFIIRPSEGPRRSLVCGSLCTGRPGRRSNLEPICIFKQVRKISSRRICTLGNMDTKMVITRVQGYTPGTEFGMPLPTISSGVMPCPKGPNFN